MNELSGLSWSAAWRVALGLPEAAPQWLIATIGLICIYGLVILPSGWMVAYLDRKLSADFQARVGPNRAGPAGFFQPLADLLKLLQKETVQEWSWREGFWLGVHTMALYSTVAVLPLGSLALLVDTDMSAFLPFWATLVLALGTMLMGFSQGSAPGWFGGVRVAAQALAGAFPALVALLSAGLQAGGFRWSAFAAIQGGSPLHWTAFANPFQFLAMVVFIISGLVLLGIPPLDAGLSIPDLHGGVASSLYGRRLSLFQLGRFYGFFLWSVITVVLFLGGWILPAGLSVSLQEGGDWKWLQLLELVWLLAKTYSLMVILVWVARVNPRSRVDQITDFAWKVLSPFSLFALIGAALCAGWNVWRAGV